jgi:hypothetical protein
MQCLIRGVGVGEIRQFLRFFRSRDVGFLCRHVQQSEGWNLREPDGAHVVMSRTGSLHTSGANSDHCDDRIGSRRRNPSLASKSR